MLYSGFTEFLGFKVNSDEYKVMGLAPYGSVNRLKTEKYTQLIRNDIVKIHSDGSFELNLKYFQFQYGFHTINRHRFETLFGLKQRERFAPINEEHECIAYAIQQVTTELIINIVTRLRSYNNSDNLCLCGGVALNCAINGVLNTQNIYSNIHIPFAPGDCGCSIGAAIALADLSGETIEPVYTPYLGTAFSDDEVLSILYDSGLQFTRLEDEALCRKVAQLIDSGSIIGWFQGRMEVGPRSLGNRSILANPQMPEMKEKINASIKFREAFRPFAPSVMKEYASEYFTHCSNSPYMMTTYSVRNGVNDIPAVTHVDRTARVQTVSQEDNKLYYRLIREFYNITGCPMLLNTSFNVMGEPIVCSPSDAINTFKNSGLNYVVIGNYLINK
jgi:carbamoyltransferase